jgi:hypothetical protein
MAATDRGRALTEQHRHDLAQVRARAVAEATTLMRLIDVEDVAASTPRWLEANDRLVQQLRSDAEGRSLTYLTAFKNAEVGNTRVSWQPEPYDTGRIRRSLLLTGPGMIRSTSARGVPLGRAMDLASTAVAGALSRHVLNGSRDAIRNTVMADEQTFGHQRVTSAQPCAFCAMLASRGPVYKGGSFDMSDPRFHGPGDFKVHDHCACSLEPVYRLDSAMTDRAERWAAMFDDAQREAAEAGVLELSTGNDALNAFRRKYQTGTVTTRTIPRSRVTRASASRASRASRASQQQAARTVELTPDLIAERAQAHRAWAESAGWDVTGDGRRLVGTRPDGTTIVWELTDRGAWRITS